MSSMRALSNHPTRLAEICWGDRGLSPFTGSSLARILLTLFLYLVNSLRGRQLYAQNVFPGRRLCGGR